MGAGELSCDAREGEISCAKRRNYERFRRGGGKRRSVLVVGEGGGAKVVLLSEMWEAFAWVIDGLGESGVKKRLLPNCVSCGERFWRAVGK